MLHVDLEAAGVPIEDECGGRIDFHALRHTFGTMGTKSGISLAVMQKLMRHSDPRLTANLYTHVLVQDKADALAKMPTLTLAAPERQTTIKTGTDDLLDAEQLEIMDIKTDTSNPTFNEQIRTYMNATQEAVSVCDPFPETQKTPENQGVSYINGGERGIRMIV